MWSPFARTAAAPATAAAWRAAGPRSAAQPVTGALAALRPRTPARGVSAREAMAGFQHQLEELNRSHKADAAALLQPTDAALARPDLGRTRIVPRSPAFYMPIPGHEDFVNRLRQLEHKYINLPTVPADRYRAPQWLSYDVYKTEAGAAVMPRHYREFTDLATRLDMIEPALMPAEIDAVLSQLKRRDEAAQDASRRARVPQLDALGRAVAVGRRKTASARVQVVAAAPGTAGKILVNALPLEQAFPQLMHRTRAVFPLRVVDALAKYNVFATVQGGGTTGQADAVAEGIAKALKIQNPLLHARLKKAGCLTHDWREKERKKPGLAKARKAYTWVKR